MRHPIPPLRPASPPSAQPAEPKPGSSYEAPFELLGACHERLRARLDLLDRLGAHLLRHGADTQAASAAQDLLRYFDVAAPLHHQDEEQHVFPALERQGDPQLQAWCQRLREQHRVMQQDWLALRQQLLALQAPQVCASAAPSWAGFREAAQRFIQLHDSHLAQEEQEIFPAAAHALTASEQGAAGREMAARRGLQLP